MPDALTVDAETSNVVPATPAPPSPRAKSNWVAPKDERFDAEENERRDQEVTRRGMVWRRGKVWRESAMEMKKKARMRADHRPGGFQVKTVGRTKDTSE